MKQLTRSGLVLVICAPSGTGKTTLIRRLTTEFPHFAYSVSCTTRTPRSGEVQGVDYDFITKEEFIRRRDSGWFAEWAEVHGNFYGTPMEAVDTLLAQGRDILFDVDVQGAAQLKQSIPGALFIFILPPSKDELLRRLNTRGSESEGNLARRLAEAGREIAEARWFDFCIVNDTLENAWEELHAVYQAASLTPSARRSFLDSLRREWDHDKA